MRNDDGRLRFRNLNQRLNEVDVDVIHRVKSGKREFEGTAPDTGELGCHFQDELELCKDLDKYSIFQRFYYKIWPLTQSLPELMHHQSEIVSMIVECLEIAPADALPSFLHLTSVLAQDLHADMGKHFHTFMGVLTKRMASVVYDETGHPRPELVGKMFECISYLLKYQLQTLVDEPDTIRQYYGDLLGSHAPFVREMAAKAFSVLLRKLSTKAFISHFKKVLKALGLNCKRIFEGLSNNKNKKDGPSEETLARIDELFSIPECEPRVTTIMGYNVNNHDFDNLEPQSAALQRQKESEKRMNSLVDGIVMLLFHAVKGVKGCIHSKGYPKYIALLEVALPLQPSVVDEYSSFLAATVTNKNDVSDNNINNNNNNNNNNDEVSVSSSGKKKGKRSSNSSESASLLEKSSKQREEAFNNVRRGFVSMTELDSSLSDQNKAMRAISLDTQMFTYVTCQVVSKTYVKMFRHVHPSNSAKLWLHLLHMTSLVNKLLSIMYAVKGLPAAAVNCIRLAASQVVELLVFALSHSNGRGLSDGDVRESMQTNIVNSVETFCTLVFTHSGVDEDRAMFLAKPYQLGPLVQRTRVRANVLYIVLLII